MNATTKMIVGITVAAAAGAAIGMLLSPEKGTDLQKKIKEGAKDWLNDFSELLDTGKELVSDFKSNILNKIEDMSVTHEINNEQTSKLLKH
jgi:gas vesicle protein